MPRADLLALTDDTLAALANRGLVKRALRDVEAGAGPQLSELDDAVTATWPDGTVATVAAGSTLEQASCSCPASGVCRHCLMLVLAYRATAVTAADAVPEAGTPPRRPGDFSDDELAEHLGPRAMAAARRVQRTGYAARVRRPTAEDPVPSVELASVTVRFLVPGELGYARSDAARGARPEAVALAVWAWQVAERTDPTAAVVDVQVGSGTASVSDALDTTLAVLAELLADGVTTPASDAGLPVARRSLDAGNVRWVVDAVDELTETLAAYRDRAAGYSPVAAASLVAEVVARARCARGGASPATAVLGTEESSRTPMRLARLTGLGARLRGPEDRRTLEVYLAHPESATVLVLRRSFAPDDGEEVVPLDRILRSRAGGHRLDALTGAEVVTESAVRAANRTLQISASRVARTTVAPSAGRWQALPPGLLLRDLDAASAAMADLPPAVVRPRIAAYDLRAVVVAGVDDVRWESGAQQLLARVQAPTGSLLLRVRHTVAAPGAVDVVHASLAGEHGQLRHVAGHLRRESRGLVLEPTAVSAGDRVLVPDLAAPTSAAAVDFGGGAPTGSFEAAVDEALEVTAAVLHTGWRGLHAPWESRATRASDALRAVGLTVTAEALGGLPRLLRGEPESALEAWADVHLRLLVTAERM